MSRSAALASRADHHVRREGGREGGKGGGRHGREGGEAGGKYLSELTEICREVQLSLVR